MNVGGDKMGFLRGMATYHEKLDIYGKEIVSLINSFNSGNEERLQNQLHKFIESMVVKHFCFEELVVFPAYQAITNSRDGESFVRNLLVDHQEIQERFLTLEKEYLDESFVYLFAEEKKALFKRLVNQIAILQNHAVAEQKHIAPLLESNPLGQLIMGKGYLEFKSRYKE